MSEVNPFEPEPESNRRILKLVFVGIAITKLPLFVLIGAISLIYSLLGFLVPIPILRTVITKVTSKVLVRVLLCFLGIFSVPEQPTPLVDTYSEPEDTENPKAGDIIVCNFSSYVNIFWLQSRFSPLYAIPVDADKVVLKTFWQLVMLILGGRDPRMGRPVPFASAAVAAKNLGTQLVVFPECSVTNGRAIIAFQDFGIGYELGDAKIHVLGLVQDFQFFSANFVSGNGALHLLLMLGRLLSGMKVKVALPQDIPKPANGKIDSELVNRCRFVLSRIIGVPCIDVSAAKSPAHAKRHAD